MSNKPNNPDQSRAEAKRSFASARDITERKQLEAVRQEALDRFQKITQLLPGIVYQFRLRPDGSTCVPYASEATREIYRLSPEDIYEDASKIFTHVHPDDLENYLASIQTSARDLTLWQHEYRLKFDDGTVRWLFGNSLPQREEDGSTLWHGFITDITERKQLEQQLSRRRRHWDVMERITQISLNSASIEELLRRVLDEMLTVFNADRAYFLYPCDPDAPSWSVPMERTRPEWPGAFARGMVIPMTPEAAEVFRELLASTKPLPYGHAASRCIPAAVAEQFSIRSMIQMTLRPSVGSPWVIGLHHCAQARAYDEDDLLIFGDIGQRVADALNSMIMLENLRASEENLNRAQAVGQVGSWLLNIATNRLEWSAETYRMFGIPQQQAVDLDTFDAATHPDDRDFVLKAWGDAMAGAPYDIEHRIVVGEQERWVRERARIERDSEGRPLAGIGTVQDINERKQLEMMLRNRTDELVLHNRVLQQISLGAPLCEVLEELARQVETLHPGMRCSILLVDEDGKHLRHGAAPGLPDFYNQAVNGLAIGDGMGACGTAAYRGERVIVVDVQQHAYWPEPYRDLAHRADVQSCWSQPIKDSNGRVLGTFAIYHQKPARPSDTEIALIERYADLTALVIERIRIQDNLRESEQRFRQLAENIREVFWMTDPAKGKMLYISPAYERIWGRTVQSLYDSPRDWLEAIHGEDRQRVLQAALTKQTTDLYDEEYRIVRPNGDIRWIHDQAFPIRDSGGAVYRIVGVAEDITERRLAENEIKEAKERFEMIFNVSPDLAVISRLHDGYITNVNNAFTEFSGYTIEEVIGNSTIGLNLWANHDDREKFINELRTKGVCKNLEAQFQRKDGKQHTGILSAKITFLQGIPHIVSITRDITERKQLEMELRESEANVRTILDNMQDLFYRTNQYGQITMVSASVKAVLGYEQEDVVGQQVTDLYADPDARGKLLEKLEEGGGMVQGYEIILRHKDGSLVWVSTNSHFYRDKNGNVAGVEGVGRDITGRKQAEAVLRESEASMRAILDNSPYLVWLKDTGGRYIKINKGYADYLRLKDARQVIGKTDFDLWPKELAEKYRADDVEVMATLQQKHVEEQSLDGDRMHWVETFKTPILDENGNVLGTTGFARDITERKQAEKQIYQLAFYDLLTGLPNRRLLNDRLGQTLAASKRSDRHGALMFMDLDNFKPLNDTYGHGVGDLLLMEVARRISSCVREVDTVARFGGDEFVVILSELDVDKTESLAQASLVAEKIRAILAEPYVLTIPQEGKAETITVEHHCTSSIGVVLFISYETRAEDILKWADMAMYQAKEGGRNLIRFFDS